MPRHHRPAARGGFLEEAPGLGSAALIDAGRSRDPRLDDLRRAVHRVAAEDGPAAPAVDLQPHLAHGVSGQGRESQALGQLVAVADEVDQARLDDRQDTMVTSASTWSGDAGLVTRRPA
jgi:hypothetical protein